MFMMNSSQLWRTPPGEKYTTPEKPERREESCPMLLHVPDRVNLFVWYWCHARPVVRMLLGALITGMLLTRGRRTIANLSEAVVEKRRHPSNISRFLQHHSGDIVACYNRACRRAVNRGVKMSRSYKIKRWVLSLDTTFQRKHALAMPNLIQFKEKSKGVPAGNHAFVSGILIGPSGLRIPLSVEDYLTREFVRAVNNERKAKRQTLLAYRTQIDLAIQLIRAARALLPADLELWVVADNFFEGPKLDAACSSIEGVYYVTPLDKGRVLTSTEQTTKNMKVRGFEKTLPDAEFKRVAIAEGNEPFAFLRRRENNQTKRKRGRPQERVFQVARCELEINGLGKRTVFFSWKQRRFRYNTARAKSHLKMLVTNHPSATAEEVVDAYLLRWQIELFYRELKSDLGLGHYQVMTIEGIRAHVHLALMAFLTLEIYRLDLMAKADPRWLARYGIPHARTRQLVLIFEAEARRDDLRRALGDGSKTKRGASLLRKLEARRVQAKGKVSKRKERSAA